jgi:hypothetical protein
MISTSFISGTGLKKCIPATLWRFSQARAIDEIGIEEVLEAMMQSGETTASTCAKSDRFTSRSSKIASITTSQSARAETSPASSSSLAAWATSCSGNWPRSASRFNRPSIAVRAASTAPGLASMRIVRAPLCTETCAMPCPMAPAPITPTT